jgi:DNA-binding transcriptional ArsR family regulator
MSNYRSKSLTRFARVFKALSNPHRLRIFVGLASCCPPGTVCDDEAAMRRCVGEIGRALSISPSTVSHHLRELRDAGLIRSERRGQKIECWVNPDMLEELSEFLSLPRADSGAASQAAAPKRSYGRSIQNDPKGT